MPRNLRIAVGILSVAVLIGLISLRGLHERVQQLSETQSSEERARREVLELPISTPSDVKVKAKIFWAVGQNQTGPVEVELPLSADPAQRSMQVLHELIANPPSPEQRALPSNATVLGFYVLPDGTAVADFSDALASEVPSGILSEELAVDSIVRTLEYNVPALRRLKILIHGQEVETLAGHLDLTGFFDLQPPGQPPLAATTPVNPGSTPQAQSPVAVPAAAQSAPSDAPH